METDSFCDASFTRKEEHSQEGHIIYLADGFNNCNIIRWCSKKIDRVIHSTLASESAALLTAVETANYFRKLIEDIFKVTKTIKVICYSDNRSLVQHLQTGNKASDYRTRMDIARIKEMMANNELDSVRWVNTRDQLADCMTKSCVSNKLLLETIQSNKLSK